MLKIIETIHNYTFLINIVSGLMLHIMHANTIHNKHIQPTVTYCKTITNGVVPSDAHFLLFVDFHQSLKEIVHILLEYNVLNRVHT